MVKTTYIGLVAVIGVAAVVAAVYFSTVFEEQAADGWIMYEEPVWKHLGGKYNVSLYILARLDEYESGDILYTRDSVEYRGYYVSAFEPALTYIRTYTPLGSTILTWWDYGNMIIGYGEREAISINPSEKLLISVTNTSAPLVTDPEEKLEDIASALVATDPQDTLTILKKYDAEYIFIPSGTFGIEWIANWIFYEAGVPLDDVSEYWADGRFLGQGMNTILYKMLNKMEMPEFNLVYSDRDAKIYQVAQ